MGLYISCGNIELCGSRPTAVGAYIELCGYYRTMVLYSCCKNIEQCENTELLGYTAVGT